VVITPLPGLGGGPRDGPGQSGRPGVVQMPSEINVCRSMQCLTLDMRSSLNEGMRGGDLLAGMWCDAVIRKRGTDKPALHAMLPPPRARINPLTWHVE
jgi:hypothetical protein